MNTQEFIKEHIGDDPSALRLKYHGRSVEGVDINNAILQIECRRRFGKKLAQTLVSNPDFTFPDALVGEQSTSDRLARFHASLVKPGERVVDLTAGLGIDALHFAEAGAKVTAVELDPARAGALRENMPADIEVLNMDCRDYDREADVFFIDPARRASDGSRIFDLSQCAPDVTAMLPQLRRLGKRLVVKASPMLDVSRTASQLPGTDRVICLGTKTECKELLVCVDLAADKATPYTIEAVTLTADGENIFRCGEEDAIENDSSRTSDLHDACYLYEPWPAVMKAAPWKELSLRCGVDRLQANTNLYTSVVPVPDFPGDIYRIIRVLPYESKVIKRFASEYPRVDVAARNFTISADALRKKLGVKDGGEYRLMGAGVQGRSSKPEPMLFLLEKTQKD